MPEIFVVTEHRKGKFRDITFEMLALADSLASANNCSVTAILLTDNASGLSEKLRSACDCILVAEDPAFANYSYDEYLAAFEKIIGQRNPSLILVGNTAMGMDLAPAMSTRFSIPCVSDCVNVEISDDGSLKLKRQIYGGKIDASLIMKPSPRYIVTVRAGVFSADGNIGRNAKIENFSVPAFDNLKRRQFIEYIEEITEDVDITAADILVSVGRGIGKSENIALVQEFADAIGATVSCSRPVADKGWLPKSRQVGTSGKTVKPKIYIALGISGAFQHQAGMKNAGTIIAVNKDPNAPIFNIAHYGIVMDLFQFLPRITEKFKQGA